MAAAGLVLESQEGLKPDELPWRVGDSVADNLESQEGLKPVVDKRRLVFFNVHPRISRRVETKPQVHLMRRLGRTTRISRRVETLHPAHLHVVVPATCLESQEGLKPHCLSTSLNRRTALS